MSAVMPYTPEQAAAWRARTEIGPEPIEIGELPGWTRRELDASLPNERHLVLERGATTVHVARWWDRPLSPGYPMQAKTERTVKHGERTLEVLRTSMFDGRAQDVQVVFILERTWTVRIVWSDATPADVDTILAATRIA